MSPYLRKSVPFGGIPPAADDALGAGGTTATDAFKAV